MLAVPTKLDELPSTSAVKPKAEQSVSYTLGYIPALDGLRGLSVLLILGYHDIGHYTSTFSHWLNAWYAVDLFFIVSGYLITSILLKEQTKTTDINLKNFYLRRWLRIAPAYYLSLGAYIIWHCMGGDHHLQPFIYAALYLTNLDLSFNCLVQTKSRPVSTKLQPKRGPFAMAPA